jgi:hypothetical protein
VIHKNVTRRRLWNTRSCHNPKIIKYTKLSQSEDYEIHEAVTIRRLWNTRSCHNPKIMKYTQLSQSEDEMSEFMIQTRNCSHKCFLNHGMLVMITNITITRATQHRTKHRFRVSYSSTSFLAFLWISCRAVNIWQIIFSIGLCLNKIGLLV